MAKTPTIEELEDASEFKKTLTLAYEDVASFVVSHITSANPAIILLWISTIISVFINVLFWIIVKRTPAHSSLFTGTILGFIVLPLALAPVHEGIHFLFLKATGAKDIRLGMDLKQGVIYLSAHRHVLGKGKFKAVALSPFILVSAGLCTGIFFSSDSWIQWVLSSVLLVHTTMCIGDLALLGFMQEFTPHSVYTWDDLELKEAYFFVSTEEKKAL
jgi:hypothetical protein